MTYKVTALGDVTFRAYVRGQKLLVVGGAVGVRPVESEEWITLRAGESREGLGLVLGISPRSLPQQPVIHISGIPMVLMPSYSPQTLPKDFFGLLRLEAEAK